MKGGPGVWPGGRLLVVFLGCCVAGLGGGSAVAFGRVGLAGAGGGGSVLWGSPLAVSGSPVEGEQLRAQEEARRDSPVVVAERVASRMRFHGLGAGRVASVAAEAFPVLVEQRAGGMPSLGAGERIAGYLSANVARVVRSGGRRGVIESVGAMAREISRGHFSAIDLGLKKTGGGFVPVSSNVAVRIPRRLGEGVRVDGSGVSLTPVNGLGSSLGGSEGLMDGASVIYPNTQTDMDTVAKPTSAGFEVSAILRSVDSPRRLFYRVGMPSGASLVQKHRGGPVQVLDNGVAIATVLPPSAQDAAGTVVPVVMGVSGDSLVLEVSGGSGEYQWPIEVDPELYSTEDRSLTGAVFPVEPYTGGTAWVPIQSSSAFHFEEHYSCGTETYWCEQSWFIEPRSGYSGGEFAGIQYETQGESRAYKLEAWLSGEDEPSKTRTQIEFQNHAGALTNKVVLSEGPHYEYKPATLCSQSSSCEPSAAPTGNIAQIIDYTTKSESIYGFWTNIWAARVYVAQEKGPTTGFNTSSATIAGAENRPNVLYGSGSWLGPNSGAYEVTAHDPGIGVSSVALNGPGLVDQKFIRTKEGACAGVQCTETYSSPATYMPGMADGEDSIKFFAEDAMGLYGYVYQTVKVDGARPYNLEVSGWPKNREISAAPHTLTVEATDGKAPTPSSGVQSIKVAIDGGQESTISGGACSSGPCTASGSYTLHAEGLTEGVHRLVVTATDNAGNVSAKEWTLDVRHASPVSVGPGAVDPTAGQFQLSATDVSLGGTSGVSRVYQSRNLMAGSEGPLGPQWTVSLGGSESLTALPEGSVVLTAVNGGHTTFNRNSEGEFESPLGDSSLKIEAKEPEKGKGITEYLLSNAAAGTTIRFTQPTGTESTTPIYANQFGGEGVMLDHPTGVAIDSSGNVWASDYLNNRIVKFSAAGTLLAAYGSFGHYQGEFNKPRGIAINQGTGNVYISDEGNERIVELNSSGAFVAAFGWGVSDGNAEFEVCTSYCRAGIGGSGDGQFSEPKGLAIDGSGNVWITDAANSRIEELNASGAYQQKFGTPGSGEVQFKNPSGVTFSGGKLYVSEYGNNRVQELSTAGKYEGQFGKAGSGNGEFKEPRDIATDPRTGNLYVTDTGNNRVQEFSPGGTLIAKFGSAGPGTEQFSEPKGVAVSSSGGVYVSDYNNNRVQEWMRPSWLPTLAEGPLKSGSTVYAYKPVEVEAGKTIIEPSETLAPAPVGITCGTKPEELKKGCRGLTFEYAAETTAKGESSTEWGTYKGHLNRVEFHGWDSSKGAMTKEVFVAQYSYDTKGRLRAEWDPRISPALKTVYGYDTEEHITALTRPGQETWALTYGTIPGDSNTGRMIKATQAPASTVLWNGKAVTNTEAPKLSGTVGVGATLEVTNGTWGNGPVAYGYLWEDCNKEGKECTPILGATNASYTATMSDLGYTLVAQVRATNGGGSVLATSVASSEVARISVDYSLPEKQGPYWIAPGSDGNLWFTESEANKISKITLSGSVTSYSLPSSSNPEGIAAGPDGNMWFTDHGTNKVGKITTTGSITEYSLPASSAPNGIAAGPDGNMWLTDHGTNKVGKITTTGSITEYSLPASGAPYGITVGPDGNMWVAENGTSKIAKITMSGTVTEYPVPAGSGPFGITAGPDGNLWFTNTHSNKIGRITTLGSVTEYPVPASSAPYGITAGPDGNLWFTDTGTNKIGRITTTGTITEYNAPAVSVPTGIVTGPDGNLWFTEYVTNRVGKITFKAVQGDPHPQPGSTVEYHVPVSGANAPYNLSEGEVGKWAQKDQPVEGMAVFAPDEPMGWPASDYKRASIEYMDEEGRTVNTAPPSGGIATTEYNETNEVVRTLSPDNRAEALKGGSKSAEVSEKLDTERTYNEEGTELLTTLGPEHKIKLSSGSEVQARDRVTYSYDENSPEGKHYGLVTKTVNAALVSGKEEDKRTTVMSYGAQGILGWTLRKPTSVTNDPGGLNLTTTTKYEAGTGNVIETQSPGAPGNGVSVPPVFASQFGVAGSENGQFKEPKATAMASTGNVYVLDTGNSRIEEFSASGGYIGKFGSWGAGNGSFKLPYAMTFDAKGNLWVADTGNNRVQEFNTKNEYQAQFGSTGTGGGQFKEPKGIAVTPKGSIFVADIANNRVEKFNEKGEFLAAFGFGVSDGEERFEICTSSCRAGIAGSGTGQFSAPRGVAASSNGDVWVVDGNNRRIEEFSESGEYITKTGSLGTGAGQFKEPKGIAIDPTGHLWVADAVLDTIQEFTSSGIYLATIGVKGTGNGQFEEPWGMAFTTNGNMFVADIKNNRVQEWEPIPSSPNYVSKFGSAGSGNGQVKEPRGLVVTANGNVVILDTNNNRVQEFSSTGTYLGKFGSGGKEPGQFKSPYGIAISPKGNLWIADTLNNRVQEFNEKHEVLLVSGSEGTAGGQFKEPKGIAVTPAGNVYVGDAANNRVEELNEKGEFMAAFGFGVSNGETKFEICTSSCRAGISGSGTGQFNAPIGVAADPTGGVWVADKGNNRVEEFNEKDEYVFQFGSKGSENGQFKEPKGIVIDSSHNVWVADNGNNRVQEFTSSGTFLMTFGEKGTGNGQFEEPWGLALATNGTAYTTDVKNNRVEIWTPPNDVAHDTQTIYYSAEANTTYPTCGEHPEWANLVCQIQPGGQPEDGISLPVSTFTYNLWDEIETTTEKFGPTTRTKAQAYDNAGRALTSETTSTIDTPLPKVTNEYNKETGALEKQSTTTEGKTKTITNVLNTLGQLTSYTDADANTTTYEYEPEGDDRLTGINDGKGTQTYAYDPTTGFMTKLVDSAAGTFTASYDVEGKMLTETYPNGMTATNTHNPLGQTTGMEYVKTTHCSSGCTWFSDNIVPSIHGETLSQTSTLAKDNYTYDKASRLNQTQEEPTGKGCTTRVYSYDEESNRTSLTTREPGSEGKCTTEGGTTEKHIYDTANRLTDSGITYEAFGNTTILPAVDAGGHELTSSYYVDGQVATQTQNEQTINYNYDPAGRTRETISTGKTNSTVISHYAGPGEALTWTSEGSEKWSRNIPGIDGALDAIQSSTGTTRLELHDLQGNVVAEASTSETETKLLSTYNSTEFGVPNEGTPPPKYAWLGATGVSTELASGVATKGGVSYIPQIARDLQTEPVTPPGAFPNGIGGGTPYTATVSSASMTSSLAIAKQIFEEAEAARQAAAKLKAEEELQKCREEGGCGAEIYVDPIHEYLVSPLDAIEYGEMLCNCAVVGEAGVVLEEIFGSLGGKIAQTVLAGGALENFGRQLLSCGEYIRSNALNRCRITIHTLGIPTPFGTLDTWIPTSISIDACYYSKKSSKGLKRGLNCPGGKYYGTRI